MNAGSFRIVKLVPDLAKTLSKCGFLASAEIPMLINHQYERSELVRVARLVKAVALYRYRTEDFVGLNWTGQDRGGLHGALKNKIMEETLK